jgi:hypothetical protein
MPRLSLKQPTIRLNLDMLAEIKSQLEELRDLTHADSMSEVIRRALAVYDLVLSRNTNDGWR